MKKVLLALLLITVTVLLSCGAPSIQSGKVEVTITDDGCGITGSDVHIKNYYPGARVNVEYLINNNSSVDIEPTIYIRFKVDPSAYSKGEDYVAVPTYYMDWLDLPTIGTIESGMAKSYILGLAIPENCDEVIPDKWAFKVGVVSRGGFVSNAVATWWRVEMR